MEQSQNKLKFRHIVGGIFVFFLMCVLSFIFRYIRVNISNFNLYYNQEYTFIFGCYVFPLLVIIALLFSQIQQHTNIKNKRYILYNPSNTWRVTWFIGGLIIFFSYLFKHHLYYIYLYFIAVGIISFLNYLKPYATIENAHLTIYHGMYFFRKKIILDWNNISKIHLTSKKVPTVTSGGGRVWVSVKDEVEVEQLCISLKKSDEKLNHINTSEKNNISINTSSTEICLVTPPNYGFENMLELISLFYKLDTDIERTSFEKSYKVVALLYYFIFSIPLIMLIITRMFLIEN